MAKGMTAPGAPEAQEGFTPRIILYGANPISQIVDRAARTIVNRTLPGHDFYNGRVILNVAELTPKTSRITIIGTGTGPDPAFNEEVGRLFFGNVASRIAYACFPGPKR